MEPITTAALIAGGSSLLGSAGSAAATSSMNKKTRKWSEMMWEKQRANENANWDKANAYNSPSAVMERLKAAGLNPYMVYGDQSSWSGGTASPAGTPSAPSWSPKPVDVGAPISAGISSYYNTRLQAAQLDNVKSQNQLIAAQTYKTIMDGSSSEFDVGVKRELRDTSLEAAKWQLEKLQNETTNEISRGRVLEGTVKMQDADLGLKELANKEARERIENLRRTGALQDFEINLRKQGISTSDPVYLRVLTQWLTKMNVL